jgi:hypothetical protein
MNSAAKENRQHTDFSGWLWLLSQRRSFMVGVASGIFAWKAMWAMVTSKYSWRRNGSQVRLDRASLYANIWRTLWSLLIREPSTLGLVTSVRNSEMGIDRANSD